MPKIDFGGVEENVVTSDEFTLEKAREILKDETITVLGYGVQGPAQALNLKDNGFEVIIGQLEGDGLTDPLSGPGDQRGFLCVRHEKTSFLRAQGR